MKRRGRGAREAIISFDRSASSAIFAFQNFRDWTHGCVAIVYYALSNGGALAGTLRDSSIAKVEFPRLAGALGQFLAQQNYPLARDSKSAELPLLVN